MRSTIDATGRVVVPKPMRERLALEPGTEVEIVESDGTVVIAPIRERAELIEESGMQVIAATGTPVTAEQIRALRDAGRR